MPLHYYCLLIMCTLSACQWLKADKKPQPEPQSALGLPNDLQRFEDDFYYRIYRDSSQLRVSEVGDQLRIHYSIRKDSQLLEHSYENRYPTLVQLPKTEAHNFFTQALSLMTAGDSMDVYIEAQKAGELLGHFSEYFEAEEYVHFSYKVKEQKSFELWKKEQNVAMAHRDSVYWATHAFVKQYKTNEIEGLERQLSGLEYKIIDLGLPPLPREGDFVRMHYSCWLVKSTEEIQSSLESAEPIDFLVGDGSLIPGWDFGAQLIGRGGSAFLVVPPNLAYGKKGIEGYIPENAVLCFYIENLDIIYRE